MRQYRKEKYLKNRASKISYQKTEYHENPVVQKICKYLEIAEMRKDYQKMMYQSNSEIRYQENLELHKNNQKIRYQKCQEKKKSCERLNFLQQVKQGPYYICTICHGSLSQGVV